MATFSPSGQFIEALLSTPTLLPDSTKFLERLSIITTYQHSFFTQHFTPSATTPSLSIPLCPYQYFDDLVDQSIVNDITTQSFLDSCQYIFESLCTILIQHYQQQQQNNQQLYQNDKNNIIESIFGTKIWFDMALQLLIYLTQCIQFKSYMLINTHEATGIDNVHVFSTYQNQRYHWKLQNSCKFFTPQISHILQLIIIFYEQLLVQIPLIWYAFMSNPYTISILSPIWSLPLHFDEQTNSMIYQSITPQEYQRYLFNILLSQPNFAQNQIITQFLTTQITTPSSSTHTQSLSDTKLPLYSLLIHILLPFTIYSSQELLYIQSLRQTYLASTPQHLQLLTSFESIHNPTHDDTKSIFFTIPTLTTTPSQQVDTNPDLFQTPTLPRATSTTTTPFALNRQESVTLLPPPAALDEIQQQSEITKLGLFYNQNACTSRLLNDIYQLDLAQQEKYFMLCQQRTKIDNDVHFIISKFLMFIYNYLFLGLQFQFHQIAPNHTNIPTFSIHTHPKVIELFHINDIQYQHDYNPFSYQILLSILPTIIALSHSQEYLVNRPLKRILFLIQTILQSKLISATNLLQLPPTTGSQLPPITSNNITTFNPPALPPTPYEIQSIIINTLATTDFITSKLTSPTPIRQLPSYVIQTTIDSYTNFSSYHQIPHFNQIHHEMQQIESNLPTQKQSWNEFMLQNPSTPFFVPTTISRDLFSDPLQSFTANALFQYPTHIQLTADVLLYIDLTVNLDTKARTDYSQTTLLTTQKAQDEQGGYYSAGQYTPLLSPEVNTPKIELETHQTWKDIDHFSFLSFLFNLTQQQVSSQSIPTPSDSKSISPSTAIPWLYQCNAISTSDGDNTIPTSTFSSPTLSSYISPLLNRQRSISTTLPTVLTLGVNDFRFIIDILLTKLSQQPLYLTQHHYPQKQHIPFIINDIDQQLTTTLDTPTSHSLTNSMKLSQSTILSLDLLTTLQFTTLINFIPISTQLDNTTQSQHTFTATSLTDTNQSTLIQPSLHLFLGLLFSADVSNFYSNPFQDIDDDNFQPFTPYIPPSYHLLMLTILVRLVLSWKEWDGYRLNDVLDILMNTIESLRKQKLEVNELIQTKYGDIINNNKNDDNDNNNNDGKKDQQQQISYLSWSPLDESLLDTLFAILGQFVIKIDEKTNPDF